MRSAAEPCRTCDGLGYVETAAQDSRVIHYEPCPDCGGPFCAPAPGPHQRPLIAALAAEYATALARSGFWQQRWSDDVDRGMACAGARDALRRVAERLGVTDLHERAALWAALEGTRGSEGPAS